MKLDKWILPIAIIIGSLIIGGFLFLSQIEKQSSIERQKEMEIELEREKHEAEKELENKKWVSQREKDCLEIYKTEKENWNNTNGYNYIEYTDTCFIEYVNNEWQEGDDPATKYFSKEF